MILFRFLYLPQITTLTGVGWFGLNDFGQHFSLSGLLQGEGGGGGCSGGATVLGKLPVPGRPTNLD